MPAQLKIWAALAVCILAAVAAIWQIANIRGFHARSRRRGAAPDRSSQRHSDIRILSPSERKLYAESQRLLQQNKVAPAARILEQLNMPREAIQSLEDAGLIHEAAKILMRMQRHNRAGVVYARHGMWDHAAQCFKLANMPLEVAKCAREAGDMAVAAEYFEKVSRFEDAADCFEQLGDDGRAARMYLLGGNVQRAMQLFDKIGSSSGAADIELQDSDIQAIVSYLGEGRSDQGLAELVRRRGRLADAILLLVTRGALGQAAELFARSGIDLGPQLMADVSYEDGSATYLARVFSDVSSFHYAGMVYERMSAFDRAAEAFESAGDDERAAYCYERAGLDGRAQALKSRAPTPPKHKPHLRASPQDGRGGFALADVASSVAVIPKAALEDQPEDDEESDDNADGKRRPPHRGFRDDGNEESTALLASSEHQSRKATPPPPPQAAAKVSTQKPGLVASFALRDADTASADSEEDEQPEMGSLLPLPALSALPGPAAAFSSDKGDDDEGENGEAGPQTKASPSVAPLDSQRAAFHRAKFFADLDFDQKDKLWAIGKTLSFGDGDTVLTYNDEPKGVYVIIQGSVSCFRQVGGTETYVDQMAESESFGELWLLADQPTAVRFVAAHETRIRIIDREAFTDLLDKDGTIARKVYKRFTLRLLRRLLKPQNPSRNQAAS